MEAQRAGMSAEYIERLKQVQSLEKARRALDDLTTSVRNAPAGFKIERYIHEFAPTRKMPTVDNPFIPTNQTWTNASQGTTFNVTGPVYIDAKTKTPKKAFEEWGKEFKQFRSTTIGLNDDPAKALGFLE
jgi:hypothetical protein